jgi:hypothetical protein
VYLFWRESSFYNSVMMQTNGGVKCALLLAVKFAEAFALLANEFTCTFTNEEIVRPIFLVFFCLDSSILTKFGGRFWR